MCRKRGKNVDEGGGTELRQGSVKEKEESG